MRLALDILTGREYNRENVLPSMMITPENVEMVSNYGTELQQLNTDLVAVRGRLEQYFGMYHLQAKILWASVAVIVLLAIAVGLTWRGVIQIRRAHRRQKAMNKEQTLFYTNASHQLKTPLTLIAGPLRTLQESGDLTDEQRELLEMAGRNVRQLEEVVADVLHFRKDGCRAMSDAMAAMIGCSNDIDFKQQYNPLIDDNKQEEPVTPDEPTTSGYDEQYRPQIHYTPAKNWVNDPNGLVYLDGTWHLFYQYNPQGNVWGNMSWGHATSTDLVHWKEQAVALTRDALGDIFSGSCVIDKDNPGGPITGSGTMYFTGHFDGKEFKADERDYPLWLDYGMDNYAGVTWSNTGDRHVMIGWMNNWSYSGDVPCSPWRSAFTLPRELKVTEYDGKPLVASTVVKEIDAIAGQWQDAGASLDVKDAYQLQVTVGLDQNSTITLSNDKGEQYVIDVRGSERTVAAHRNAATGATGFNGTFSIPSMQAPLCVSGNTVTLDIYVDRSSVELFTKEGTMAMTNLVFPGSIYNKLTVSGAGSEAKYRVLNRIW